MSLKYPKLLQWEGKLTMLLGTAAFAAITVLAYIQSWIGVLLVLIIAAYLFMVLGLRCDQEFLRIHNFDKEE